MMPLRTQLISICFSFVFGMIFNLLIRVNSKALFNVKKHIQILSSFLFLLDVALCYFLCLRLINNGILHLYFFLAFLLGWYVAYWLLDKLVKK